MKKYISNLSGGRDSLYMTLSLMERGYALDYAVFYDGGMEFSCIYKNIENLRPVLHDYGCELVVLKPETNFLFDMFVRPVNVGSTDEHFGYDWCGGPCRWQTGHKVSTIQKFLSEIGEYTQYVGIAANELGRIDTSRNKEYPLVEWGMTEADCLAGCYRRGWHWYEASPITATGYVDLYSILNRVSCWCCGNKNLEELRNMYYYLPNYWNYLKGMQSRINRPFRSDGRTIFDLEKQFVKEGKRCSLLDLGFDMGTLLTSGDDSLTLDEFLK